jgi:hypothetical protein
MTKKRFDKVSEAIWRQIGDEVVILMDDGLSTHVLNKTAACIWEACDGVTEMDDIVSNMCQRFDVEKEQALEDTEELVEKLIKAGVLKQVSEGIDERAYDRD